MMLMMRSIRAQAHKPISVTRLCLTLSHQWLCAFYIIPLLELLLLLVSLSEALQVESTLVWRRNDSNGCKTVSRLSAAVAGLVLPVNISTIIIILPLLSRKILHVHRGSAKTRSSEEIAALFESIQKILPMGNE